MRTTSDDTTTRQRGGGLVEFCFTMPVLLLIAGATVDVSRYMRFLQATTFVSQETAGQIYRQCSDITIYEPPDYASTGLTVDTELTEIAIQACVERIQVGAQQLLEQSVGSAAVGSKVFRWNVDDSTLTTDCSGISSMNQGATEVGAKSKYGAKDISEETKKKIQKAGRQVGTGSSTVTTVFSSLIYLNSSGSKPRPSSQTIAKLEEEGVKAGEDGIYQTKNGSFQSRRLLVSASALCRKGRLATVEVSYAFEPVVKFLPDLFTTLQNNGTRRETTVL